MEEIIDQIKEVMRRTFNLNEIPGDISQYNCEKWDSLRHLNLIVELETVFNVTFEPEEIVRIKDFQDIFNTIMQCKNLDLPPQKGIDNK